MAEHLKKRTLPVDTYGQRVSIIVPTVFVALATIALVLRFWARRLRSVRLLLDDYLALLALVMIYGAYVADLVMVLAGGTGMAMTTLSRSDLVIWFKALVSNYIFWISATSAVQVSALAFYIRLFGTKGTFRITCYGAMGIVVAFWISAFVSELTACVPLSKAWTPGKPGHCINDSDMCSAIGIIHIIFDFAILALPAPVIWQLKTSRRTRVLLTVLLMIGVFASACSILRMACLIELGDTPSTDKTGAYLPYMFQTIEAPVGLICVCLPSLLPVWEMSGNILVDWCTNSSIASSVRRVFSREYLLSSRASTSRRSKNSSTKLVEG